MHPHGRNLSKHRKMNPPALPTPFSQVIRKPYLFTHDHLERHDPNSDVFVVVDLLVVGDFISSQYLC